MSEVMRVESLESRGKVSSYRDLVAWQKSIALVKEVYRTVQVFPKEELYGLTNQLKRSVLSVPSNIAEGSSRRTTKEFLRYINIASGSLSEVETQLIVAHEIGFLAQENLSMLLQRTEEISRILQGLYASLAKRQKTKELLDS